MGEVRTADPRWRLDAVALTVGLVGLAITACVITYQPATGVPNQFGPASDQVAAPLVNAIGGGVVALIVGGFVVLALYVAKRSWWQLSMRASGWTVLTACATVASDYGASLFGSLPISAFGKGGSVGAYIRFALDDSLKSPLPYVLIAAVTFLGLVLVADGVVRSILKVCGVVLYRLAIGAVRGNRVVARIGDRFLAIGVRAYTGMKNLLRAKRAEMVPLVALVEPPVSEVPPIIRHTELPIETPIANPTTETVSDFAPVPVPITMPPKLKVHDPDAVIEPPPQRLAYETPSLSLLSDPDPFPIEDHEQKLRDRATQLEQTFLEFNLKVKVVGIHTGPVITQYEVALDTGMRLNKVTTLSDDLALKLGVAAVRIVAPLPGRNTVGIEVPNEHRQTVRLKELILATTAKAAKFKLPIFLGKDVEGRPLVYDMADMPHLLIAGRTGTGKSVCLNAILQSFLFTRSPEECRLILIDPKRVEFTDYGKIPHLMHPVVVKSEKAEAILAWAVDKMEDRYEQLSRVRVRNIHSFNELSGAEILRRAVPDSDEDREKLLTKMPYIVIVIDEVGDLLMEMKKEVESHIIRLAQKSRAAGIHLILATQKPTVDVITGLIKSNLPARICFQVASRADSAVVLDEKGADKLLGMGDMLFLQPKTSTIIRGQGAYVDDKEIERVTAALEIHEPNFESELLNLKAKDASGGNMAEKLRERDPLYEQAVEVIIREQRGSTSLLQRALGIGYGKASRFIDFMHEDGLVGAYNGSNARDVLVSNEEWELRKNA